MNGSGDLRGTLIGIGMENSVVTINALVMVTNSGEYASRVTALGLEHIKRFD
jgi:hypothetical protein